MAEIKYERTFSHQDWIDNEDVVQAEGENGFNGRFHSVESELDEIGAVVGTIDTEIKKIQRMNFLTAPPPVNVGPGAATPEFQIELYDRTGMPPNVEKVYFPVIVHVQGSTRIFHTILYRQAPQNRISVSVQFFNADPGNGAQFAFRVLTFAAQA
jgi:hypothetical protein